MFTLFMLMSADQPLKNQQSSGDIPQMPLMG
jgi:hypothetical protein